MSLSRPAVAKRLGEPLELGAVGGQRNVLETEGRDVGHALDDARMKEGLAAGDPDAANAGRVEPLHHGPPARIVESLFEVAVTSRGTAVHAGQIAAIGERHSRAARWRRAVHVERAAVGLHLGRGILDQSVVSRFLGE